jgi:mono/diheme cytochrome c family protein
MRLPLALVAAAPLSLAPLAGAFAQAPVDFGREIRPILADNCFTCHGPDEAKRQGDLRLDIKEEALADRGGYAAFVARQPDKSESLHRISSADPEERMPPPDSGKKLTPAQIGLLRRWVAEGAVYGQHWAFVAPRRPAVPRHAGWARGAIDAFVLDRLKREGLSPSPEADRITLLRRLSLDLLGLPPSAEEVEAFLADARPDAYERLVERLLAAPQYGERWGRHWLDAARYADSDGYEKDKPRFVWMYRDWVVDALNRDLPYDQFVIQQIAGDLLPETHNAIATQAQRVATGFLRNSMINEEGGIDPEQFRMEAMFDRMDAIGKAVLGLTVQCAQCHNHKYDPFTHEDYYRIFAFLNDCHEANIAAYTADEQMRRADIFRRVGEVEAELQRQMPDWAQRMARWEEEVTRDQPQWTTLQTTEDDPSGGQKMYRMKDGSYLCQGYAPTKHTVTVTISTKEPKITAFRLEQLNDPNLPLGGPGRSIKGTSALTEFKVTLRPLGKDGKPQGQVQTVKFVKAVADANPSEKPLEAIFDDRSKKSRITGPVGFAIDGKDETAWCTDIGPGRRNRPCQAVFVPEEPIEMADGCEIQFHLVQNHGGWNSDDNQNHNLGRFRLSITGSANAVEKFIPARAREVLRIAREQRSPAQKAALFSAWRTAVADWKEANDRIEALWRQHPEGSSQLALAAREEPRTTSLLHRGDFLKPVRPVTAGVPSFLHPLPAVGRISNPSDNATGRIGNPSYENASDRLTFARWLVDRNSPTAARALVNRVWQTYFGIGLVSTSEDLGSQCEPPSHPELLDWLAVEFMEPEVGAASRAAPKASRESAQPVPLGSRDLPGWSLKHLHRLIVTSSTYRQSSRVTPELLKRDPYNRLLARGPRFRVEAEAVRDIALAASGLLDQRLGGPSVYPPAPDFLFLPPASYGPKVWKESQGGDRYRRALYTFRFRSVPYPALQNFDAPNGDFACVRRVRSNTPLAALTSLNEPAFVECAQALALKTLREGGSNDEERLSYAFRRCISRSPAAEEQSELLGFLRRQVLRFSEPGAKPWDVAAADPAKPPQLPPGVTPPQLAAWTALSRVLLNLDETVTKE